jgi:hypothetical protein
MNKDTSYGQIKHFLRQLLLLCYWITPLVDYQRVLVDESGVFPPVVIIPPWFTILIYHIGDEQ